MGKTLVVEIWRGGEDGRFQSYDVPRHENQTVLDVVTYVQRSLEPSSFTRVKPGETLLEE